MTFHQGEEINVSSQNFGLSVEPCFTIEENSLPLYLLPTGTSFHCYFISIV